MTASVALPERYDVYWRDPFDHAVERHLSNGTAVLDIGSGRTPSIAVEHRPAGGEYVGLDISAGELEAAGPLAYSDTVVSDIALPSAELVGRFDLALSWQVLEHVEHLAPAVDNIRSYLSDGGTFVALLSGSYGVYSVLNTVLPDRIGHAIVKRTMDRQDDKDPVFEAHYDQCSASGLRKSFASWSNVEITPFYRAANYFAFSAPLQKAYIAYENLVHRRRVENLATHYLVVATK